MTDAKHDYTSAATFAGNFKNLWGTASEVALNLSSPYRARVKKTNDFTGTSRISAVSLSLGGGRASGSSLPDSNARVVKQATLSKIEAYGKYVMDRKTLIAGSDGKGSFERADKLAIRGTLDGVNLNIERQCFGDGTLGTLSSVSASGVVYTCVITAATWIQAKWMVGDYVNIESGNTDKFEVTSITPSTRTVVFTRLSGSQVPAGGDVVYMQKSEGNELIGYAKVFDTSVTSLYGITKQYGWQPYRVDAASATISMDLLADIAIDVEQNTGRAITEIHASVDQFKKLLAANPDPQYFIGNATHGEYKMSYKGLKLLSPSTNEEIPVLLNRFIHGSKVYLLNTEESELAFAPQFGWFAEGPQRITGTTEYEYPYGGELAHYVHPAYQAELHTLAQ